MKNVLASDIVKIVQKYKSYITSVCKRFYIAGGTAEDLFEEGIIGLIEACNNYNGEDLFEDRFDAFAKLCIKRQIIDAIKKANLKVIYTPLNGAGNKPVRKVLKKAGVKDIVVVKEQEKPDGNFPTCPYPNPEIRQAFECAIK